jgi:hypothetical protein
LVALVFIVVWVGLHDEEAPEKGWRQVFASQWSTVVPHQPYWEQHSLAAHLAFPFWGPQLPAKATDTRDKRAKAEKRIMTMIKLFE